MVKNGPVQSQVLFEADMSILRSMMDWIHDHLLLTNVTDGEKRKIEVALEEALVNIISYAYKKRGGQIEITLYYSPNEDLGFTIPKLGTFKTHFREKRKSFNPYYKNFMMFPPKRTVTFHPGSYLKEHVKKQDIGNE